MFSEDYLQQIAEVSRTIDAARIERTADLLATVRQRGGRLFMIGVGGSAANASHAVNDFRKICGFECYAPTDNASELTARINDEGWDTTFSAWLQGSRLRASDAIFVLSVGGGHLEKRISTNIIEAVRYAKSVGAAVAGIVGRDGGFTLAHADACCLVPVVDERLVTFHAETFQSVVLHLLAAHPKLKMMPTKWEEVDNENLY